MNDKLWKAVIFTLLAVAFLGLPFSFLAWGSDISTRQSSMYPFNTFIEAQDDFLNTTTTSALIGALGFSTLGGTTSVITPEANRPGIIRRETGAVINTASSIKLGTSAVNFVPDQPHMVLFIVRLNTNDNDTTVRVGSFPNSLTNPFTDGIYFEKVATDTNWFCTTRSGGTQTRTDSTIATSTNWITFRYVRNSSGVTWLINGSPVCGTHTTNITSVGLHQGVYIINLAAANKTIDLDYFQTSYSVTR